MNIRVTIGLVLVLGITILVAVIVFATRGGGTPTRVGTPQQFFYTVSDNDINKVIVAHNGTTLQFVQDAQSQWHFNDSNGELVDLNRWGGVTLLLSGPQYKRKLTSQPSPANLTEWGLDNPTTTVTVGLKALGDIRIKVGARTPQSASTYTQFERLNVASGADPGVYLVDSSWGDVIARLTTEPPHIPTPTPGPSTATPDATATSNPK
ncbi:MAG: hypothetical protein HY261_09660 [Chloroflexi bacterium]|nr:hypothetical protein [Chloroflexota bacterium]